MGLTNNLTRSSQIVNLIISFILLFWIIWAVYVFYKTHKKNNKDNGSNLRKKLLIAKKKREETLKKNTNKNIMKKGEEVKGSVGDDETSLVQFPVYKFENNTTDYTITNDYAVNNNKFYNYSDLKALCEDNADSSKFFTEYIESVKKCYEDKKDWYMDKLDDKLNDINNLNKPKSHMDEYDENLKETKDYVKEISTLIEEIEEKQKTLTLQKLKNNFRRMIWNKKKGLESMIGRDEVKDFLAREIFAFKKDPTNSYSSFQNFLVLGDSGMGKNKLAECMAFTYCMAGITVRDRFCILSKGQIESQFVSGTGPKIRSKLLQYLDAIILLDEIYGLVPDRSSPMRNATHGEDAINQIVFFTEEFKGKSRIGGMGYEGDMLNNFLGSNQGMGRRFPENRRIVLGNYSDEELTNILIRILINRDHLSIEPEEANALHGMISLAKQKNKGIFKLQAGAVDMIASHIVMTINSLKGMKWIDGNHENNKKLLLIGFSDYLARHYKFGLLNEGVN